MVSFRKSLMVGALLALCAGLASAQVVTTGGAAILRSEGVTEPLNPVTITSTIPGAAAVTGTYTITLFSSAPVTSFLGTKADGSDNAIQLITNAPNAANPGSGTPLINVGGYPGTISNATTVTFPNVMINGINAGGANTFTFTVNGLRVNASTLAQGGPAIAAGVDLTFYATPVDTTSPVGLFAGSQLYTAANVAYAIPTFGFSVNKNTTGSTAAFAFAQCDTTTNVSTPTATTPNFSSVFSIKFSEGFSKSFQTMLQEGANATNGTRLSATFSGFPANTQLWVPIFLTSDSSHSDTATQAVLMIGDDSSGANGTPATMAGSTAGWVAVVQGTPVVYEITQAFPGTIESLEVQVAVAFTGTPTLTPAAAGTVVANYAPVSSVPGASNTAPIPRFDGTKNKTETGFYSIVACSTSLLFPYITTQPGWNVGIAVSNTGADPFGGIGQSGTCDFSFYGAAGAPTAPVTLGANAFGTTADRTAIKAGTTASDVASNAVGTGVSFTGYAIAVCDFQFAHGYAFIIGNGTKSTLSNGYLALVLESGKPLARGTAHGQFEQVGN